MPFVKAEGHRHHGNGRGLVKSRDAPLQQDASKKEEEEACDAVLGRKVNRRWIAGRGIGPTVIASCVRWVPVRAGGDNGARR